MPVVPDGPQPLRREFRRGPRRRTGEDPLEHEPRRPPRFDRGGEGGKGDIFDTIKSAGKTDAAHRGLGGPGAALAEAAKFECPVCGSAVDEDAKTCPSCGAEFAEEAVVQFECPACGATVDAATTVCPSCGVTFASEEEIEASAAPSGAPAGVPARSAAAVVEVREVELRARLAR